MKEKIIVFGLGNEFQCLKEKVLQFFDVVACTDNLIVPIDGFWKKCYIAPHLILKCDFDKILICTKKYQYAIKVQLVKLGIAEEKIIFIDYINKKNHLSNFKEVINDMEVYIKKNVEKQFAILDDSLYLIDEDKYLNAGIPCQHYFAQDIWGSRKIYRNNPKRHYDIGSRLDGFIAHLLVFREVNYIDLRPLPYNIPGLNFIQSNAVELKEIESESIESLSCFHALEHFGLGRYGDEIEPEAYKKAARNMQRVLKKGGRLYIGVPIGPKDKLIFNAHRIFSVFTILSLFEELQLMDIAYIDPDGVFAQSISIENYQNVKEYSCGLFEFEKID